MGCPGLVDKEQVGLKAANIGWFLSLKVSTYDGPVTDLYLHFKLNKSKTKVTSGW